LYAVEWSRDLIQFLVDNQTYFSVTPASLPAGAPWVFNGPQFLILNLAVGGSWPGDPDGTTVFPQRMLVDYVRVYTATQAPAPIIRAVQKTNHAFVEWPATFPQALLESAHRPIGPWIVNSTDGRWSSGSFFSEIRPGYYRLQIRD
jgi:beta-glucanase (GH16 family)